MIEIKWTGIDEFGKLLDGLEDEVLSVLEGVVDRSGEHCLAQAQKLAPKLTGDLEGSGTPERAAIVGGGVDKQIGFGGLPYVVRRHEEVYNPGTKTRGKPSVDGMTPGRKFLENPVRHYANQYFGEWAKAVRDFLSRRQAG